MYGRAGLALPDHLSLENFFTVTDGGLGEISGMLQQWNHQQFRQRWRHDRILARDLLVVPQTQTTVKVVGAAAGLAGLFYLVGL